MTIKTVSRLDDWWGCSRYVSREAIAQSEVECQAQSEVAAKFNP